MKYIIDIPSSQEYSYDKDFKSLDLKFHDDNFSGMTRYHEWLLWGRIEVNRMKVLLPRNYEVDLSDIGQTRCMAKSRTGRLIDKTWNLKDARQKWCPIFEGQDWWKNGGERC